MSESTKLLLDSFQELNMNNYSESDVGDLNQWGIESFNYIIQLQAQVDDIESKLANYRNTPAFMG